MARCIPGVSFSEMAKAHSAKVWSEKDQESGSLTHFLDIVDKNGDVLTMENGLPVRWSNGRTYNQLVQNGEALITKYGLDGSLDQSGVIRE